MEGVAHIPVVPVGYEVAEELLLHMGGQGVPASWEGGLKLVYRTGPGPVRARVESRAETGASAYHPAYNTLAVLEGTTWPEEWVVIGAHRDAWGPGAVDNVSGTASVVEVARAFSAAARQGWRPRRTLVFATWDAEEWGVMGSIEWVEANAQRVRGSVVAYVNQDAAVSGASFGAASSPELKTLVRAVPRSVANPREGGSVYETWLAAAATSQPDGAAPEEPPVGDLGGGSDHAGFYEHLGIPSLGFGFGGPFGVYHSMYDTPRWMEEFGDPGYLYHATTARIAAIIVARLANAEVLPFDHAEMAAVVAERAERLAVSVDEALHAATATEHVAGEAAIEAQTNAPLTVTLRESLARLWAEMARFEEEGRAFAEARDSVLSAGRLPAGLGSAVNGELRAVSRAFLGEHGMPGDSWTRQLLFATDPDNGYATLPLPGPRLTLRGGDLGGTADRLRELSIHMDRATRHLRRARELLEEAR